MSILKTKLGKTSDDGDVANKSLQELAMSRQLTEKNKFSLALNIHQEIKMQLLRKQIFEKLFQHFKKNLVDKSNLMEVLEQAEV